MRAKRVATLPKCDICGAEAEYDAPTKLGPWANMCKSCWQNNGSRMLGTKFVKGIAEPSQACVVPLLAKRIDEEHVKCPKCGEERYMEPDAQSKFNCEGCGIKLHCLDVMHDTGWMEIESGLEGAF